MDDYSKDESTVKSTAVIKLKFNDAGKKVFERYTTDIREAILTVNRETAYSYWVTTDKIPFPFGVLKNQVVII